MALPATLSPDGGKSLRVRRESTRTTSRFVAPRLSALAGTTSSNGR
jgi:hypothetical protein